MPKKLARLVSVALVFCFLLALCACGAAAPAGQSGSASATAPGGTPAASGKASLRVALILSGTISDQGWNAMAYNGLKEIEEKYGAEVKYKESVGKSDMEEAFRTYAAEGFDIVFGHGFEFSDAALMVGPEFPDTIFLVTSSEVSKAPNVGSVTNSNQEVGFLVGVVGAYATESKKIGSLNGMDSPQIALEVSGIQAGINYVDSSIEYQSLYVGSFDDVSKAKEMALTMSNSGIDVIQGEPSQMSTGILEACDEKDMYFLGVMNDFSVINAEKTLTSGLVNFGKAMSSVIEEIQQGKWTPGVSNFGVKEDVVYLAPLNETALTAEEIDKVEAVLSDIRSGKIDVDALIAEGQA